MNTVKMAQPVTTPDSEQSLRAQALILNWFGSDTINFNRAYVEVTGDALSALWLSHVLDRMEEMLRNGRAVAQGNGYTFRLTGQECEQAIGITRNQQSTCRKQLIKAGILSESSRRGKSVDYTIHLDRLFALLEGAAAPLREALKQQIS